MSRSAKRICGLDLRADQVCIVQYSPERESIDSVAIKPVPEAAGDIWEVLLREVPQWITETRLRGRDTVCAVCAGQAVIRRLEVDKDEDDVVAALEWEISQHISGALNEYAIDYLPLESAEHTWDRYLSVACRRSDLQRVVGVARASKLNPVVVDLDAFALVNLFEFNYRERRDELSMILHGDESSISALFTRSGEFIDIETMQTPGHDVVSTAAAFKLMESALHAAHPALGAPAVTYYAGPLFSTPEIVETLEGALGHIEMLYPFRKISCHAPGMGQDDLMRYAPHLATAVGLALRGSIG